MLHRAPRAKLLQVLYHFQVQPLPQLYGSQMSSRRSDFLPLLLLQRLSPIAITSMKTCTASLIREILSLKTPPIISTTAITVLTTNDTISILVGRCKLVANVDIEHIYCAACQYLQLVST